MENLIFSLNATVPIFFTMILGFVFRKVGLMDEEFTNKANKFVFQAALPALLFSDLSQANFRDVWNGTFVAYCALTTIDLYRDLDFDFLSVERQKYPGRICAGGLPEQRCNPWYCIYPEYIWNIRHGAIDDHCFGADL